MGLTEVRDISKTAHKIRHPEAASTPAGTFQSELRFRTGELGRVDNRRHGHLDHLGIWLALACLLELRVEAVAADVGRARQQRSDMAITAKL